MFFITFLWYFAPKQLSRQAICTKRACSWSNNLRLQLKRQGTAQLHSQGCVGSAECHVPSQFLLLCPLSGVNALIFVGLEQVKNLEEVMQLEFGRGFTYNRPLRANLLDLEFELAEQLVSDLAQAALPGCDREKPKRLDLDHRRVTPSWLQPSCLPTSFLLFTDVIANRVKSRSWHCPVWCLSQRSPAPAEAAEHSAQWD